VIPINTSKPENAVVRLKSDLITLSLFVGFHPEADLAAHCWWTDRSPTFYRTLTTQSITDRRRNASAATARQKPLR
jgi:hypothetical protein